MKPFFTLLTARKLKHWHSFNTRIPLKCLQAIMNSPSLHQCPATINKENTSIPLKCLQAIMNSPSLHQCPATINKENMSIIVLLIIIDDFCIALFSGVHKLTYHDILNRFNSMT